MRLVRDIADLDACLAGEALGVVFHFEGAEAIDADLDALDVWYAAGLRSVGLVWSRPNAFAHGVPFRFPSSPDTGAGPDRRRLRPRAALRRAGHRDRPQPPQRGRVLGRRAHARRPADRLALGRARALHRPRATSPTPSSTRSARSGGLVGINFDVGSLRADGGDDADTPLERRSPSTPATWPTGSASTTSRWARTSTARRCPPSVPHAGAYPGVLAALEAAGFEGDEVDPHRVRQLAPGACGAPGASRVRACEPVPRAVPANGRSRPTTSPQRGEPAADGGDRADRRDAVAASSRVGGGVHTGARPS